jgi:hypothetical protein
MKQMFEVGVFGFRNDAPLVNELVPVIHSKALARVAIMNTKRERGRSFALRTDRRLESP